MSQKNDVQLHTVEPKDPFAHDKFEPAVRPRRYISFDDLPEGKDWANGKKYIIVEEVEQISSDKKGITVETLKIGGKASKSKSDKKRFSRV